MCSKMANSTDAPECEFEALRFDFNEMMSVSTYALKVYPPKATQQGTVKELNTDDSKTSRRKPETPRRLSRSVEHYASTPKVGLERDSENILQKSVLSPIQVTKQQDDTNIK